EAPVIFGYRDSELGFEWIRRFVGGKQIVTESLEGDLILRVERIELAGHAMPARVHAGVVLAFFGPWTCGKLRVALVGFALFIGSVFHIRPRRILGRRPNGNRSSGTVKLPPNI